jgi:serine/threonine-protein kinase Chk1
MFDSKGLCQIIDLGMCVRVPEDVTGYSRVLLSAQKRRGKAAYVCPEVVREHVSDPFAADVWSLGVILHILLTLRPLYECPEDVAFAMLCEGRLEVLLDHYGFGLPPPVRSLLKGMLCPDMDTRLTLEEVLHHPWMLADDDPQHPQQPAPP